MKRIKLTQEQYALVDDNNYKWLNKFEWSYSNGYAVHTTYVHGANIQKALRMHRLINKTPKGYHTDHIDHDTLNNQEYNLRSVTSDQNNYNRLPKPNCSSMYKGVYWSKKSCKWMARISKDKKAYYLGLYEDEKLAASIYNKKAIELFGEYAYLNKV